MLEGGYNWSRKGTPINLYSREVQRSQFMQKDSTPKRPTKVDHFQLSIQSSYKRKEVSPSNLLAVTRSPLFNQHRSMSQQNSRSSSNKLDEELEKRSKNQIKTRELIDKVVHSYCIVCERDQ